MRVSKTVYHGTKSNYIRSIALNGFDPLTDSCATFSIKRARKYGETVISFKYDFHLTRKNLKRFVYDIIIKDNIIPLHDFKPKQIKIER